MTPTNNSLEKKAKELLPDHGYINNVPRRREQLIQALTFSKQEGRQEGIDEAIEVVEKATYIDTDIPDNPEECCSKCIEFGKHDEQRRENRLARKILQALNSLKPTNEEKNI